MKTKKEKYKYVKTEYTTSTNKFAERMQGVTLKFRKFSDMFQGINSFESSNFGQLIALNAMETTAQNCEGLQSSTVQAMRAAVLNSALMRLEELAPKWDELIQMGKDLIYQIEAAQGNLSHLKVELDAEHHAASGAAISRVRLKKASLNVKVSKKF